MQNFKAWLSDSTTDAKDRLTSNGPWVRVDGVKLATDRADLLDGNVFTAISVDQNGAPVNSDFVWTNSKRDGLRNSANCNDWQSSNGGLRGTYGQAAMDNRYWTESDGSLGCSAQMHLYCFED